MVETPLADNASVSRPPSPRGQRAGGPPAREGITRIGKGVVIEGEVKGGENLVIDGKVDGTIELLQHVLTVGPTGRVKAELSAKSVVVLGQLSGSIQANDGAGITSARNLCFKWPPSHANPCRSSQRSELSRGMCRGRYRARERENLS